jgi:uracil-DNA glycosylase family 4
MRRMSEHPELMALWNREEKAFHRQFKDFIGSSFVEGEGSFFPLVMVIGEAPGAQENTRGRPFCGESGIILRMLMSHAGLEVSDRQRAIDNAWLTNVVKLRPPGNRKPTAQEIELARPYLRAEWEALRHPKIIVCLGNTPLIAVTGKGNVMKRAGDLEEWESPTFAGMPKAVSTMYLWPMLHPSNAIRHPPLQKVIEGHWDKFGAWFHDQNP